MLNVGVVGLGKMGLVHAAIVTLAESMRILEDLKPPPPGPDLRGPGRNRGRSKAVSHRPITLGEESISGSLSSRSP